jgi:UDP-glucose 4-epimerase
MADNMKQRILVTGGAGFVGSNLIKRLKLAGHDIISIDNYSSGKIENHIDGVSYYNLDTKNFKLIEYNLGKIDAVYHLGEYSRIHPSFEEYEKVWNYNTAGTFEIVNFCLKNNIKLVYAGSSTRFATEGINHSPYSFTKSMNTELIKNFGNWFGLKYSICYFYNVFGPGYNSSPIKGYESVISVFEKQYKNNEPLTVVGDGNQQRMFTYVDDIVDGLIKSFYYDENEEFQLANPKLYSILDVAKMFSNNIIFIEKRKGDRNSSVVLHDNARKLLNWSSTIDVNEWINTLKNA